MDSEVTIITRDIGKANTGEPRIVMLIANRCMASKNQPSYRRISGLSKLW